MLAAFSLSACGAANSADGRQVPDAVVLRIDRVAVAANRPNGAGSWDGPAPEGREGATCSLLAWGATLASPVAGQGMNLLCGLAAPEQVERNPQNPDLRVRLAAGTSVRFDSPTAEDATDHVFGYEYVVPLEGVPKDGIQLQVLDADSGQDQETIGVLRLTQQKLVAALQSPTGLIEAAEGGVLRLEIVVTPYVPATLALRNMPATASPTPIGDRKLAAGEFVTLHAEGGYTVGSWYDKQVGPSGYPGERARSYNFTLEPFHSAPLACGIALVGDGQTVEGALVAPDGSFQVLHAGALRVGLNDSDPGNNQGSLSFHGAARAPTAAEWTRAYAPSAASPVAL